LLKPATAGSVVEHAGEPGASATGVTPRGSRPALAIDPFPAMRNISLRWQPGSETVRSDVEAELAKELAKCSSEDNPVAGWFLTLSSCLFGVLFLGLVGFIIFKMKG
jgi:hypothetical protein